jgi:RND family efflux transporter MFP subunit
VTLEQANASWQSALTGYQRAERELQQLQGGPDADEIERRQLALDQAGIALEQAQRNLEDAAIVAPHDGIVASVGVTAGAYSRAGATAFTIVDDSAYFVDVTIDEIDIGAVEAGMQASLVLDAYPDTSLGAVVERIAPAPSDLGGVVAYQVRLRITDSGDIHLRDGLTATVTILTAAVPDVLMIPNWAIRVDQDSLETYTYRVRNGSVERVTLEVGRRSEAASEVLSGLAEGDTVALVLEDRSLPTGPPAGMQGFGQ